MDNVRVVRYSDPTLGYAGYIESDDCSWIIFVDNEGRPKVYFPNRDETGAVIDDGIQLS